MLSAEPHPNADRLRVCEVDAGDGPRTIVCGAPNVAAGQTVAVALPGAVLPDGDEAREAKLRGIESNGMILSRARAGDRRRRRRDPGRSPTVAAAGTPLSEVLAVAEPVLELEPTSNRVDCFGVYGVARELHAVTGAPLAPPPWDGDAEATGEGTVEDYASVAVEVPDLCPRFSARVFTDVTIGPSPPWLKARLTAAGMRPINNVVDITNYVMLLTAQPLHAFDLDEVPGGELIVRAAHARRTDDDARRDRAQPRPRDGAGLRPRGADRHRRDHGRPGLRGQRLDHPGAARGRDLERSQHPAHVAQARAAVRRLEPQREAAAP